MGELMDGVQEKRARKLVNQLEPSGEGCGLLAVQGMVVMRCLRDQPIDTPMMCEEIDLQNAVALDLLEQRKVTGSYQWEWYCSKRKPAKTGDWIIFTDGSRRKIGGFEKGIAFYGEGSHDLMPVENLVPASNADPTCWEIDANR
jgi:hypothetical protein